MGGPPRWVERSFEGRVTEMRLIDLLASMAEHDDHQRIWELSRGQRESS